MNNLQTNPPLLVGNTFPLSLIRRPVRIEPRPVGELQSALASQPCASFWGHASTLPHASRLLGADLSPKTSRPAILLDQAGLPALEGISFAECWVLSPDYQAGFRPQIGQEIPPDKITGWQALKIQWL